MGGSGVLNPSFHGQPRVIPPVLKRGKGFQTFNHEFLLKVNMLDIFDHFVGQTVRVVPVGDPLKQKAVLLREGFSPEEIRGAYQLWNFLDAACQSKKDRAILKRCRSPRDVFELLGKWYDPENEVPPQHLSDKFHEFSMPQNSNRIAALHGLEDINNQMEEKEMERIPDTACFVRTLPAEYDHAKTNTTIDEKLGQGRDHPCGQHAVQRSSRPPEHVFFSGERGNRSGALRRHGRNRGCGRGSSRGRNSSSGGGHSSSSSASGNTDGSQGKQ